MVDGCAVLRYAFCIFRALANIVEYITPLNIIPYIAI